MATLIDECLDCLSSAVQMNMDFNEARSTPHYPLKVDDDSLCDFAETLCMDSAELEGKAKSTIRKILKAIIDHSGCAIDRICVSGSVGHQPDNSSDHMGFDITVFVDCTATHGQLEASEHDPEKKEEHMECSIQSAEKIYQSFRNMISSTVCECDHFGLHFGMDGYFLHIAVSPSFAHKMHLHRKHVWDLIEKRDKESKLNQNDLDRFSISLHESLTSFMHMGDPGFHGLVRLARFWRQNVLLQQGCGELSSLAVVLVMMRCIEDEKAIGMSVASPTGRGLRQHPFPVKKVFEDFLRSLSKLDSLTISYQRFYEPDLIPERHLSNKPYILDPVNPWRNVIHNMTHEGVEWAKSHAAKSLKLMQNSETTLNDLFLCTLQTSARGG